MVHFAPLSKPAFSLALTLGSLALSSVPAMALPWAINPGTQVLTNPVTSLSGEFIFDDESLPNPTVTFSNVLVGSLVFTAADVVDVEAAGGVTAIDWLDGNSNLLSLVFSNPLTSGGGTIVLDSTASGFTPFNPGVFVEITGSVTGVPEPLTLLGAGTAIALGATFKRQRN